MHKNNHQNGYASYRIRLTETKEIRFAFIIVCVGGVKAVAIMNRQSSIIVPIIQYIDIEILFLTHYITLV